MLGAGSSPRALSYSNVGTETSRPDAQPRMRNEFNTSVLSAVFN